jgi:SAM-dependent methyltransferase
LAAIARPYHFAMHTNSKLLFKKYARQYFRPGMRVLEIGPNGFPAFYQRAVNDASITWDTLDVFPDKRLTHVAKSEYEFPIADNTYDIVLSGQVIEHVKKIWRWMKELSRVCKVGGTVITINPVSWPYHEAPVDCWRAFPEGMKALYDDSSLEVILSQWESLEEPGLWRRIPGRSKEWQPRGFRLVNRALGWFGFPVECAFDTITIGRKLSADDARQARAA